MSSSSKINLDWTKESLCKGDGYIVEGIVKGVKMHSIFVASKTSIHDTPLPTRFVAIQIELDHGIKRNWKDGVEIPPKMIRATAISKGYLNKFDRIQSSIVDKVDSNALLQAIGSEGKALPRGFHDDALPYLHPSKPNYFEFWADAEKFSHKDTKPGDEVRIKTIGNSIFIESLVKMDINQISNFSGDSQLGDSWTTNIMKRTDQGRYDEKQQEPVNNDDDDDEWK
eukprot:gene4332-5422_t